MKAFVKKNKGIENISDDCLNTSLVVAYVMAKELKKTVIENEMYDTFKGMLEIRWNFYSGGQTRISLSKISEFDRVKLDKLREELPFLNLDSLAHKNLRLTELPAFLFDFENISSVSILDGIRLTKKDLEEILYSYIVRENAVERANKLELSVCLLMYLKSMIKAYKQGKEHYFKNNKETMLVEFEGIEKELKTVKDELKHKNNILLEAEKTIKQQEKEIKRLQCEVTISYQEKLELHALRELMFSIDQKEEHTHQPEQTERRDLNQIKAVILGGHERWQTKMKEVLPGFTFIHPDNANFSKEIIENTDYLFIYTNYLNHAIYYRAMAAVKEAKICFLKQVNEALVLDEIERTIN